MTKPSVSKVLYSDKEANALLRETCKRTTDAGGSFTIRQTYDGNWFVEYTITPAEDKACST